MHDTVHEKLNGQHKWGIPYSEGGHESGSKSFALLGLPADDVNLTARGHREYHYKMIIAHVVERKDSAPQPNIDCIMRVSCSSEIIGTALAVTVLANSGMWPFRRRRIRGEQVSGRLLLTRFRQCHSGISNFTVPALLTPLVLMELSVFVQGLSYTTESEVPAPIIGEH